MTSWLIIIIGAIASWHYTDLDSASGFNSTFCPISFGIFLILGLMKLVGSNSSSGHGGSGGGFFGDGGFGGDGGGDGGGC